MPAGHGKEAAMIPHLIVARLPAPRRERGFRDTMDTGTAHTGLGIAVERVNPDLRPVGHRSSLRIAAMVEIDTGIGISTGEHIAQTAAAIGARVFLLPLLKGDR